MRICYFGTYDPTFPRNALLLAALRAVGAEVVECRAPLWRGTADKLAAVRGRAAGLGWRIARAWRALLARHRAVGDYDVLLVGYAGHLDVLLAHSLARRRGRPLVLDAFLSLAETLEDRNLAPVGTARWRLARLLDRLACRRADRVLVDTRAHAVYFARALGIPPARLAVVPMGAWPRPPLPLPPADRFEVLYYGAYIPLHGLEYMLDAAAQLADLPHVHFTLVGDGQEYAATVARARRKGLANVRFVRTWLPEDALVTRYLATAHVCLGIFGASPKAARVVPAKVFLALAAGRPVVTRDSPAAREVLVHGEQALLCPPADGTALASALRRLHADAALRARLAAAGPPLIAARYSPLPLGQQLLATLTADPPDGIHTASPPTQTGAR
ncbi:MAG TPA: glycosyltransferase [Chloroflexota bacterium]|nr:glycosyltransferase [Chloroflexota bacterium]